MSAVTIRQRRCRCQNFWCDMNRNGYLYPPKSHWRLVMWKLLWPSPTQHSKNSDGLLSIGIWNHLPLNTLQSSLWREKRCCSASDYCDCEAVVHSLVFKKGNTVSSDLCDNFSETLCKFVVCFVLENTQKPQNGNYCQHTSLHTVSALERLKFNDVLPL